MRNPFHVLHTQYVNLDNGNKGAQVDPKTSMLTGTKIVIQRTDSCRIVNKEFTA